MDVGYVCRSLAHSIYIYNILFAYSFDYLLIYHIILNICQAVDAGYVCRSLAHSIVSEKSRPDNFGYWDIFHLRKANSFGNIYFSILIFYNAAIEIPSTWKKQILGEHSPTNIKTLRWWKVIFCQTSTHWNFRGLKYLKTMNF